jgi:hypothetical protein
VNGSIIIEAGGDTEYEAIEKIRYAIRAYRLAGLDDQTGARNVAK